MKPPKGKRKRRRRAGVPVRQTLTNLWKTSNCVCAKRLIPFLPCLVEAMERHGELDLDPGVRAALLRMSAATADRLLQPERRSLKPRGTCTTKPGTLLRRQIPVRTFQRAPLSPRWRRPPRLCAAGPARLNLSPGPHAARLQTRLKPGSADAKPSFEGSGTPHHPSSAVSLPPPPRNRRRACVRAVLIHPSSLILHP